MFVMSHYSYVKCFVSILTTNIKYFSFGKISSGTCIIVNPVHKQKEKDKRSVTPYKHVERWSYAYFFAYFESNTYFVYNIVTSVYLKYNVKCIIFQI